MGGKKMDEGQTNQNNLVDTTDCLEAIGVIKCWKNGLFWTAFFALLLLQVTFWIVDLGCVKTDDPADIAVVKQVQIAEPLVETEKMVQAILDEKLIADVNQAEQIKQIARKVAAETNQPKVEQPVQTAQPPEKRFAIKFKYVAGIIKFLNYVLVFTSVLYCLTMLFGLKISLFGRLGGINHITRAFFLSLTMLIFLLPWQKTFGGVVTGVMFTPQELIEASKDQALSGVIAVVFYYLRFTVYWLFVVLMLLFAQVRGCRWSKAILRRLEVV
ncbi:MAG: hypothetical protein ACYST9_01180 [Planctomycetota bacterium]|jgi:hypothetical protein